MLSTAHSELFNYHFNQLKLRSMKNTNHPLQLRGFLIAILFFAFLAYTFSQDYVEIPLDEEEHFNISLSDEQPSYYSILAGANTTPSAAIVSFFTVDNQGDTTLIDFIDITIDDSYLAGIITGPNGLIYVYKTEFTLSLPTSSSLPPAGTIENVELLILFLNSSTGIIGGLLRENMSITLLTTTTASELRDEEVKIFPNPAHEFFTLETQNPSGIPLSYSLFNATGQRVRTGSLREADQIISTLGLPKGRYLVEVVNGEYSKLTKQIIIY